MLFNKKVGLIFLISLVFILSVSVLKIPVISLSQVSIISTVYADNWWEDWGTSDQVNDSNDGGSENNDTKSNNWWDDNSNQDQAADQCQEDSWTDKQTSGEFYCNDGKACYKQWSRDSSCNIHEDGEDCHSDSRCQEQENNENGDESCKWVMQYPECQADGQIYEAWQDCHGNWDPRPTGQSCDAGGGQGDEEENQGSCGENQYWDTASGQCVVNLLEQTKAEDEIYCREQCNGSCAGALGAKYCTNPEDGSAVYDCNDPQNQINIAECQNVLEAEFAHIGIDPAVGGGVEAGDSETPACTTAQLESGECRGAQFCNTEINYCGGEIVGSPSLGNNCNLVPGLCGVKADENGNLYVARPACNPECSDNQSCLDDGSGAGYCHSTSSETASSSLPAECEGITNPDRQDDCIRKIAELNATPQNPAKPAAVFSEVPARCQSIINPDRLDECIKKEAGQPAEQSDTTCQAQTATEHYCDGNVCIEKSSGWDGNSCVPVYKSVSNSSCNNSCGSDSAQSGQTVKLLNCLDDEDPAKRDACTKENIRIYQTGQKVDQASQIKASLSIDDCSPLEGEAKEACENKNNETRFLARVLDFVQLEDCANKPDDQKKACDSRNAQAIRQGQVRLNLGVEDCSKLTGDQKINCEFANYQRDQKAQAIASFQPEDCSKYQIDSQITACEKSNQRRSSEALNNSSPFVGLAELGAVCVYTEACEGGAKKACAGKVASDNGAPVCRYDPGAATCSECSTGKIDLAAIAQQAAANAPIDPAKYFSQKFEDGAVCKQVQACDDGQEQVCEGKGANGACDLSQGGGICSPCQAKGTITLNKVATCNAQNKCEGAPALSGCMNDDQCKPVEVVTARTSTITNPVGPGQVNINNQIYNVVEECKTERRRVNDYMNYQDSAAVAGDESFALQQSQNVANSYQDYVVCAEKYIPTGRQAVATIVQYDRAVISANNSTNQVDYAGAAAAASIDSSTYGSISAYEAKLAEQQKVLENLRQAEAAMQQIKVPIQQNLSAILDRSSAAQLAEGVKPIIELQTATEKVNQSLAETAQARAQYNQFAQTDPFSAEANQAYLDFEDKRKQTQDQIGQLAALRRESGSGVSQQYQSQLDQLPTKADEQFKETQLQREVNQLSNLVKQSNNADVVDSTQNALADRVDDAARQGNIALVASLQRQSVQASFNGWLNVYASKLSQPGGDSEKGGTADSQDQIQNLIDIARVSDPQAVQKMEREYQALPSYIAALRLAREIQQETVGIFAGTVNQDNNTAFYSVIANAEEQAKSQTDLANLVDRTCSLSASRCESLKSTLGITDTAATPDQIAASVVDTSQTNGARAANLLVEQAKLLPQIKGLERSGGGRDTDLSDQLTGRAYEITQELAKIDPNLAARSQAQINEAITSGQTQNQEKFAATTYANNKTLLTTFSKALNNGIEGSLNGLNAAEEAEAAKIRMQSAIDQMRLINPEKAEAMQSDLDLVKFKLDSFHRGNAMVNPDGCVIEVCQGNGVSAQNICTGQVAESKSFNRVCATKNGVVTPTQAAQLELEANRQSATQANIQSVKEANSAWESLVNFNNEVGKYTPFGPLGLAKGITDTVASNYQNGNLSGLWQGTSGVVSSIGSSISLWGARASEGSIPIFEGTAEEQIACRDLWQNSRVQGAQQIQRGTSSLGCTIDTRSSEEKSQIAAQIANNGGTVKDIFSELEGVKADSKLRQLTLERAAEEAGFKEAGMTLDTPIAYWTPTQRDKFYEKLSGLDNAGAVDVFDAIIFPTAALSEVQSAIERCTKDWGRDLCQLDTNLAATYQGIAQGDAAKYEETLKNARVLNPGLASVPQADFAWIVDEISKQQRGGVVDLMTAGTVPTRDQFDSDDAYYRAITADLAPTGGTGLTREQLINRMLLDANKQGITSADGSPMTREKISNAVDAFIAVGDFGRNVVNTSEAYQWQRASTTEFNWQLAQDVVALATFAGPLERLDPTNPIVEGVLKVAGKAVSVPTRAVTGTVGNVLERIETNTAKKVLQETYGLTRSESNALVTFYNGQIAEKTVAQSIAELTPAQKLFFGQATDKIGAKLGLTETPDHLMAATILDSVLKPKVSRQEIAALVDPPSVDRLAKELQTRIETPAYDGTELVRNRVINGQVDGLRIGQATDEENVKISEILKDRCRLSSAGIKATRANVLGVSTGEVLAAVCPTERGSLAEVWQNLSETEKKDLIRQSALELASERLAIQKEIDLTPTSGKQALFQLAEQAKVVAAGNTTPALNSALTDASTAMPDIARVIGKLVDSTPLTVSDKKALELAGINQLSLQKNLDPINPTAKFKLLSAIQTDPTILAKSDFESVLLNQGLTSNQASMLSTTLQPLAPTPPIPVAQDSFFARLVDTWDTLFSRNPAPTNQAAPNTANVAHNPRPVNQSVAQPVSNIIPAAPGRESDGQLLARISQHPDFEKYSSSLAPDGRTQVITVQLKNEPAKTLDELRADPRFATTNQAAAPANPVTPVQPTINQVPAAPNPAAPVAPVPPIAPVTQPAPPPKGFFDPVRNLWNRLTGQAPQQPIVIDAAQRAQQRTEALAQYTQEKAKLDQLQQRFDDAFAKVEEARIANEHAVAYRKEVENRNIFQRLIGTNQTAVSEARLRQELTERQLKDAKTVLDQALQDLSPQKIKTFESELAKGDLTAAQAHEMRLEATRTFIKAKKTIADSEKALDETKGKLWRDVDATQKMYVQTYRDLFNYNKTPNPVDEAIFLENWQNYKAAIEAAGGKADDAGVKSAADNLTLGSTKLPPDAAENLAEAIENMNEKIAAVNKVQRELVEAQQIVTNYKAEVALLRQTNIDARAEQELVTSQNKGTLPQIEQALKQQGITGRTEVKLYLDSNGELLLTPDAGISPQNVIGIFNKSGDTIKLEKVIISTTVAPKAGENASAVFTQLEEISPRRTVRFWEKNIEIEKEPDSSGTTRFQSRFEKALEVNIQAQTASVPTTAATTPVEQIIKEAQSDLISDRRVIFDPKTDKASLLYPVTDDEIRKALIRQGMSATDPDLNAAVRRIADQTDEIADSVNCNLASVPTLGAIAANNSNVLGASATNQLVHGEVLAASTSPCGPFTTLFLKLIEEPPSRVIDVLTFGKVFDAYANLFVKVDASLPEPVLRGGNEIVKALIRWDGLIDSQVGQSAARQKANSLLDGFNQLFSGKNTPSP